MKDFLYQSVVDADEAIGAIATASNAKFISGGTSLVDLLRENIEQPDAVIDISRLEKTIEDLPDGSLKISAAVTNTMLSASERVRNNFPALAEAIVAGASGQIRNMASVAGNMLQRTRCYYFYDDAARCNKRVPGSGCDALEGMNRSHAIFGTSEHCIATHPSDMCVALALADCQVLVEGKNGPRIIDFADFHRLPGDTPHIETDLQPGELVRAIVIKPDAACATSVYRKVRDRSSYAFAIISVAAGLVLEDGMVKSTRLAFGGVAHKPWRAKLFESTFNGQSPTDDNILAALDDELKKAHGHGQNDFKIKLVRQTALGVLQDLRERILVS